MKTELKEAVRELGISQGVNYAEFDHANERIAVSCMDIDTIVYCKNLVFNHFSHLLTYSDIRKAPSGSIIYFDIK